MFSQSRTAVVAGFLGFATLAAAPAEAQVVGLHFGGGARFGVHIGDGVSRHHFDDGFHWREARCTPDRALYKARRIGLHRARIDYVNRRGIAIVGHSGGQRFYLTFARAPHCAIIG